MWRGMGGRGETGASFFEYLALGVLAAVIVAALAVSGLGTTLSQSAGTVICRIVGGADCGTPKADGQHGSTPSETSSPNATATDDPNGNDPDADGPSLADLQKQADDAQKTADAAAVSPGNIMKQIVDLLKDFIGITDIQDCFTKGSISACLWAALDVGSLFFAALKIGKFAKAIKGALKLWKDFSKGRKLLERANAAAKRAKDLLKKAREACGIPIPVPAAYVPSDRGSPKRVVHAAFADLPVRQGGFRAVPAFAAAKPKCANPVTSVVGKDSYLKRAAEAATKDQTVQREMNHLRDELMKGNINAGKGAKSLNHAISYMRGENGARLFFRVTKDGYEIVGKASKANEQKVINYLLKKYP